MDTLPIARANFVRRLVSLGLSLGLAGAALVLLGRWTAGAAAMSPAAPNRPAVSFVVTATADSPDNNLGDGQCHDTLNGRCSLRAAVQELSFASGGTINLPAGTYTLTNISAGDLQLKKDITLLGAGPATTIIQGNPSSWAYRILRVQDGANVIISGVTISGGHPAAAVGGGIDVITSTLLLTNSVVSNNSASNGGGVYNTGQLDVEYSIIRGNQAITNGGGLFSNSNDPARPGGHVLINHSQVLSNSTQAQEGAGIYYQDDTPALGYLDLEFSTVSGNQAVGAFGQGGGIYQLLGSSVINGSSLRFNLGAEGGGLYAFNGALLVTASRIETNTTLANGSGGGINIQQGRLWLSGVVLRGNRADAGGGLAGADARLDVANSSFISNTAAVQSGGGLDVARGTGFITNTVFSQNWAGHSGGGGGAVFILNGALTFTQSSFTGNLAYEGGGMLVQAFGAPAHVTLISSTVSGNTSNSWGGGLATYFGGTVTLTGTDVTSNTASYDGGGLYLEYPFTATNSIVGGSLSGNTAVANRGGGGLFNQTHLTISGTVISGNLAFDGRGGGVHNEGFLVLNNSSLRHNLASDGGGLANVLTGTLIMLGTTLSDNSANVDVGGGLVNSGVGAKAYLVNSTFSGDQAANSGGGLANQDGQVDLSNVTLAGNTADSNTDGAGDGGGLSNTGVATTTLRNSLVALNVDQGGQAPDCAGTFQSKGYNLVQSTLGCTLAAITTGNLTGQNPKLWPLGSYGGPTETRAPMLGSPALDSGNPLGCRDVSVTLLTVDQRGQPRPSGAQCDIGAVEGAHTLDRRLWLPLLER